MLVREGASGSDTLLAASPNDLRASVGFGKEGALGREGASAPEPDLKALAAAAAAADTTRYCSFVTTWGFQGARASRPPSESR